MQALARFAEVRGRKLPEMPTPIAAHTGWSLLVELNRHGFGLPRSEKATSPEEAALRAAKIKFPVVLKIVSLDAPHKTEVGGVAVGLADSAAVLAAAQAMQHRLLAKNPAAQINGFLVQEMIMGLEFFVGVRTDPLYGPFLMLGLGGITVEVLNDTAIAMLPVEEVDVRAMLASLRSAPLLGEFRGQRARDVDALVQAVLGLSKVFLESRKFVSEIEINPVMIGRKGEGVCAVDVRFVPIAQN
jgi:succinyl-CoA synthetase beta subunit